jgi:hypothetical protein
MSNRAEPVRIAVLDDYQNVALSMADWSGLEKRAAITVFNDHMANPDAVVARLQSFDVVCVMRERTPMTRAIIERLPRLRLIASTGMRNASIDLAAAAERGVEVMHTNYSSTPTIELTWRSSWRARATLLPKTPRCEPAVGSALSATTSPGARLPCWVSVMSAARWRGSARHSAWK